MAPVAGRPFLAWVLDWVAQQGVEHVVLALGYMAEVVSSYFGSTFCGLQIDYTIETEPLGTGGALAEAIGQCSSTRIACLNGDTLFEVDLQEMAWTTVASDVAMAVRQVDNVERYGAVTCQAGRVVDLAEKSKSGPGLVNGGVYIVDPTVFSRWCLPKAFSWERDFLAEHKAEIKISCHVSDGYFIDIGLPETWRQASLDFASRFRRP
jgi:D-glycero-alpha-D-manno-heptose 1-phosphate guanylyltransferase